MQLLYAIRTIHGSISTMSGDSKKLRLLLRCDKLHMRSVVSLRLFSFEPTEFDTDFCMCNGHDRGSPETKRS